MRLRVRVPTRLVLDEAVTIVVAQSMHGSFGMLPRHVDFATPLVPGLLRYELEDGTERYLGVDEGVLVKCGAEVLVSVRDAVPGMDEQEVRQVVRQRFQRLDETERRARRALAELEAGFIRRFLEHGANRSV